MTDSCNQAISSAWIGTRVCLEKDERELHGTIQYFGEISIADGKWCGIELDESLGENDGMIGNERHFVCKDKHGMFIPMFETEQLSYKTIKLFPNNFSFDLLVENNFKKENTNTRLDATVNLGLNKTFNSLDTDNRRKIPLENQITGATRDGKNDFSTLKDKCLLGKQASAQLDFEESLGILPGVLQDLNETWGILNSCSTLLNQQSKENCKNGTLDNANELLNPQNWDFYDLNKMCFEDNNPIQSCSNERYTSTPIHPLRSINFDASVIVPQHSFLSKDEVNGDEPILAGSNQTVSKIYFDDEEFDKSKILTSTSKVSLLQTRLLNKTSNFNDENDLNTRETFSEKPLDTNNWFENFEASRVLHNTNILNTTFQIKHALSSPAVFPDTNASPLLDTNCNDPNKTISLCNLTSVVEEDTITNSKFENQSLPNELNETKVLCSLLNNQCNAASETISLRRMSLDSQSFSQKSTLINYSVNSPASEITNSTFERNATFFVKNYADSQAKQSAFEHFNRKSSLSAVPVLTKARSFQTHLPVSKLNYLQKLEQDPLISKTSIEAKMPKKFKEAISLTKSATTKTSKKNNSVNNSNVLAFKGPVVQSKKLQVKEARPGRIAIQAKGRTKNSLDRCIENGDLSEHLTISQCENTFLNSHDNKTCQNRTFSASVEFCDESTAYSEWGKCKKMDELSDKSINISEEQIKKSLTDKLATEVLDLTNTKRENFATNFLDKKSLNVSHSCDGRLKEFSKKSTVENKNINNSSKCVKGVSKIISRPRLSFVPTFKSNNLDCLSYKNKDVSARIHVEDKFQDSSSISSKLYSRKSIQAPKFHLQSSKGNIKEPVRSRENAVQKENIEMNSDSLKNNAILNSTKTDISGKLCQTERVLKSVTVKVPKLPSIAIPKKGLDTVELKPGQGSKIPSFAGCQQKLQLRKIHGPQSRRIK